MQSDFGGFLAAEVSDRRHRLCGLGRRDELSTRALARVLAGVLALALALTLALALALTLALALALTLALALALALTLALTLALALALTLTLTLALPLALPLLGSGDTQATDTGDPEEYCDREPCPALADAMHFAPSPVSGRNPQPILD
jgi:hypothetical protein